MKRPLLILNIIQDIGCFKSGIKEAMMSMNHSVNHVDQN